MKIIEYRNYCDIDVQFLDSHNYIARSCAYGNFIRGNIKNPYDRTAYGIGYLGAGDIKANIKGKTNPIYAIWQGILERCYCSKESSRFRECYNGCSVCDEWHNYQNFAEWYEANKYEVEGRLHIDKDILFPGNKIYSPDKCMLVPQRINMLFVNIPNNKGLPNGITLEKTGRFRAEYNSENLGLYNTLEEAYQVYAYKKQEIIKNIAEEYKNIIPNKAYVALLNYKVNIHLDKNYKPV